MIPQQEQTEAEWLPVGEEPTPVGSITHYSILRNDGISMLSLPDGDIDTRTEPSTGLFMRDTRYLSRLRFTFGGVSPTLLDATHPDATLSAIFTNPTIRKQDGSATIPAQTLVVRRRRVISDALLESLSISNYGPEDANFEIRIEFAADFYDIFEIRGYRRKMPASPVHHELLERQVRFTYEGTDGVFRQTRITFSDRPSLLTPRDAAFRLSLKPRDTYEIHIEVNPDGEPGGEPIQAAAARVHTKQRDWLEDSASIQTENELINGVVQRSLLDILALQTDTGDMRYLAAGVPWFDTLFGRDSLIAGMELLAFAPDVLRNSLLVLAEYQATDADPNHDATPGKIAHELRWGELANTGEVPFGRYYGSIDSTPLFLMAAHEYVQWTEDVATLRQLWPALKQAVGWCRTQMEQGVRGFVAYARFSAAGLENQGWKDSHDSIIWPDGRFVEPPIALVEVQGYVAAALHAYAAMASLLNEPEAAIASAEAARFCALIDDVFGDEQLGYVLCIDGKGAPVPTAASNAGHLLWCGMARRDLALKTANRLFQPDMFSGWGVRTLSSTVAGYNPLGYHVGSVWPHDNAMIVAGLRWYGLDDLAERLGGALLETGLSFQENRIPELFSGDARELRAVPTPYPVASRPQAWSAAAIPSLFTSMLGLRPGRPRQLSVVRPILPQSVQFLRMRNLRFAGRRVDLAFRRQGRHISVEVEHLDQGIEVALSQTFPEELPLSRGIR